jgi:hypothetical protein
MRKDWAICVEEYSPQFVNDIAIGAMSGLAKMKISVYVLWTLEQAPAKDASWPSIRQN